MRLVSFGDDYRLGVAVDDGVVDVSDLVAGSDGRHAPSRMRRAIVEFERLREQFERAARERERVPLSEIRLRTPVPDPSKISGAGVNYKDHTAEMEGLDAVYQMGVYGIGVFSAAPSALNDPFGSIVLPPGYQDRRIDHEVEIAIVFGRQGRNVPREEALDYVFGYTGLLDITVRGKEMVSFRKSMDTFKPVGPMIVTKDELADPGDVRLRLWLNDELRQDETTASMVYGIPELIEFLTKHQTVYPGDIYTTGTPAGVGPLKPGDVIRAEFGPIGEMRLDVRSAE